MNSASRAAVDSRNSTLSTGPVTAEGKSRAYLNALRHGLTGQTVVLPSEDLVENNLFSLGFHEQSAHIPVDDPAIHCALAQAKAVESNVDILARLSVYEQRLNRTLTQVKAELKQLQQERREAEDHALHDAQRISKLKEALGQKWQPPDDGFEFSSQQLCAWTRRSELAKQANDFDLYSRFPFPTQVTPVNRDPNAMWRTLHRAAGHLCRCVSSGRRKFMHLYCDASVPRIPIAVPLTQTAHPLTR